MQILLREVRLSFPAIWKAESVNGGDPSFGAAFIIEPGSENAIKFDAAMKEVAATKWKEKAPAILEELIKKDRVCFRKSPMTDSEGQVYEGFENMNWTRANNKVQPKIIDRNKVELAEKDGKPYSGCYVNVSIDVWPQDNTNGKRINATLLAIQFVKDGEGFSGGARSDGSEFDDLGVDATDDVFS